MGVGSQFQSGKFPAFGDGNIDVKLSPDLDSWLDMECPDDLKDKVVWVQGDVSSASDAAKVVSCAMDNFGVINALVNNAGVATGSLLEMTSMNNLKNTFQINGLRLLQWLYWEL